MMSLFSADPVTCLRSVSRWDGVFFKFLKFYYNQEAVVWIINQRVMSRRRHQVSEFIGKSWAKQPPFQMTPQDLKQLIFSL